MSGAHGVESRSEACDVRRVVIWLLTRGRAAYLLVLVALTAWLAVHAAGVGLEHDNESLTADDPEAAAAWERFRAAFGDEEDVLVAVSMPDLLTPRGLGVIDALGRRLGALDGVHGVLSVTTARRLASGPDGPTDVPLLPAWDAEPAAIRTALADNPDLATILVSRDGRTAGIVVELAHRPGDPEMRARVIDAIRAEAPALRAEGATLRLTGLPVQKHDVTALVARDQRVLIPVSLVVLGATLWAFFRRPLGVALPLAVTALTVVWTVGVYAIAGLRLNAITALLPPTLMVLSLAVSVHLLEGWLEDDAPNPLERILHVWHRLRFPCVFCAVTTAFGFGSLATSDIPAVRDFGLFTALGVLLSVVIGMTLVPVALTWCRPPARPVIARDHPWMARLLAWAAQLATSRPGAVLLGAVAVTLASFVGIAHIRNNTDLVRFLSADAPLRRDTLFVDEHLTGTLDVELLVTRADGRPLTRPDDVRRLAAFERAVLAHPPVTAAPSVLGALRQIQRAEHPDGGLVLPEDDADVEAAFDLLAAAGDDPLVRRLVPPDLGTVRFRVQLRAVGTSVAAPLVDGMLAEAAAILGPDYRVEATGPYLHVARDSNRLVESQVRSFGLAVVLVFLAIGLLFRSVAATITAMIPNVIPILWTGGLMGAVGIDLSSGTAMIASAVLGVVVDDTIHYLTGYARAYRGDPVAAVHATTTRVGTALFVNNVVLVLGFWVGAFGSFKPTIYFSLLSGFTMVTGMICDLLVTPACLVLLDRAGLRMRR
jgi:predicted RND superfamily exporter protein